MLGAGVAQWEWPPRATRPADRSWPSTPGWMHGGKAFIFMKLLIKRWEEKNMWAYWIHHSHQSDKGGTGMHEKGNWAQSRGAREISPDTIFDLRWERWTRVNDAVCVCVCVCVRETGAESRTQTKGRIYRKRKPDAQGPADVQHNKCPAGKGRGRVWLRWDQAAFSLVSATLC